MNYIAKYRIFILILILLPFVGQGQAKDSVKLNFFPKSLRIGVDLLGMGKSFAKDDLTNYEVNADVQINKFLINFDYGIEERDRVFDGGSYHVEGSYYRIGADVNLTKPQDRSSTIFFGLRYARARYDNSMSYTVENLFGTSTDSRNALGGSANWYEITGGTKVKIWKPLWLGFTCRLKFRLKQSDSLELLPHDIPGYGKASGKNYWGFNYYIFYKIPFNKKKQKQKQIPVLAL